MNTAEFVKTPDFMRAVEEIRKNTTRKILDEHIQSFDETRLAAAKLSVEDVEKVLKSDFDRVVAFSLEKLKIPIDGDDNEYPKGEKPGKDEKPKVLQVFGLTLGFLVINLIEYILLKRGDKSLEVYYKAIRLPKIPKSAKELRKALKDAGG